MAVTVHIVQWRGPATNRNNSKHKQTQRRLGAAGGTPAAPMRRLLIKVNAERHFSFSHWLAYANHKTEIEISNEQKKYKQSIPDQRDKRSNRS